MNLPLKIAGRQADTTPLAALRHFPVAKKATERKQNLGDISDVADIGRLTRSTKGAAYLEGIKASRVGGTIEDVFVFG